MSDVVQYKCTKRMSKTMITRHLKNNVLHITNATHNDCDHKKIAASKYYGIVEEDNQTK